DGTLGVEAEPGIDLGRDAMRNDFEDLDSESHGEFVHGQAEALIWCQGTALCFRHDAVEDLFVFLHLCGFEEEAWIGGGISRLIFSNAVEITGVSNDQAELL